MKKIAFLSFGHWTASPQSGTQSAADTLLQSIDLAVEAERLGVDGAYFRVHHFARQLASPFPLLAAVGARTKKIEIGTGVIDMRYENPHYMAEDAGSADLIAGGRLQLGISRGSPEQVIEGWRHFGHHPAEGETDADLARRHAETFLELLGGKGFAQPNPRPMFSNPPGLLRLEPYSEGLRDRIWWGAGTNATAVWTAAAFRALDDVRCQAHQLVRLNLVPAKWARLREVEVGLSFEPRRHHPSRPSAERTGFRIIRCESRPRNTSDGR
jgi:alkanesulfonate monooxygenase SsuD/methylene tetrahydromethanopterin reductase-like flavin-dependent oxidoreductase (luciferase family)